MFRKKILKNYQKKIHCNKIKKMKKIRMRNKIFPKILTDLEPIHLPSSNRNKKVKLKNKQNF